MKGAAMFVAAILALAVALAALPPFLPASAPLLPPQGLETVRFNAFSSSDPALIAARARGLFAAERIDVQVAITPSSTEQMRGLGQGTSDVASTAFDNVLGWSGREGVPMVAVFQNQGEVNLPLYVRPEIRDWEDLRGRPLAVDAVDTANALVLRRILLAHGLDYARGDYSLIAIGARRVPSLERGETFASLLFSNDEADASSAGLVRLTDHREVLPDYPAGVYAVARDWGQSHRDLLVRFLRARLAGSRWVSDNPRAATELLVAELNLDPRAAERLVSFVPADAPWNVAGLQGVLDLRTQLGFTLPMGTDVANYYDMSYYQAARGVTGEVDEGL
jgi:ABC-type nitrate/sulfonate/bicarbonate transport system substrate-binding protein